MITDGWLDFATRYVGAPIWKQNGGVNTAKMYISHSAVGYWSGFIGRLVNSNDKASVHGWIAYDGSVTQLYPFTVQCWASGSTYPNNNGIAFENEGGFSPYDEPLTPEQIDANVRIIRELSEWKGWTPTRPTSPTDLAATLLEHRECVRFGSAPTACPSGRIPWDKIMAALEDDMLKEHYPGELDERRFHDAVTWGLMTGAIRGAVRENGLEIWDSNYQPLDPPVTIPMPIPEWAKPT